MRFITSDNVTLHYSDTGEKDKKAILGIPGIGGSSQFWHKMVSLFNPVYRVILLDPRNQGQSERTEKGQRIARHAADVEELLASLDLHDVIGIGNSMGAANLWAYLDLYGKGRLCAMVDLDQSPKMIADGDWPYGFKDLSWTNYPDYLKRKFGKAFYAHIDEDMFTAAKAEYEVFPYDSKENYKCLVDHAEQDWRDVIRDTPVPMLVLAGKQSPFFNYHFVEEIEEINHDVATKVIDDCGHLIQAEQPEKMHEAIMQFLHDKRLV